MSGHTPGPWQVVNGTDVFTPLAARNGAGVRAHETDGWHIADCSMGETQTENGPHLIPVREHMANARLIAAAPELLDALMHVVEQSSALRQSGPGPMDLQELSDALESAVTEAHGAICKATGADQ